MKQACLQGKQSEGRDTEKQGRDRQTARGGEGREDKWRIFMSMKTACDPKTSHNNAVCAFCGWGVLVWPVSNCDFNKVWAECLGGAGRHPW